jgi:hypothetical protein
VLQVKQRAGVLRASQADLVHARRMPRPAPLNRASA